MVIECSSCHARFKLADDKVKENGTKVRCTKCREVFTVFPETPPQITPSITTNEQEVMTEESFFPHEKPAISPTPDSAASGTVSSSELELQQESVTENITDDAGATDFDAISFDNFESPTSFSVATDERQIAEDSADTSFSFSDFSFDSEPEQYKITETANDQTLSKESENEDFNQGHNEKIDEFSFSSAEDNTDFAWEESETFTSANVKAEATQSTWDAPQDTDFSFNSFSFDETPSTTASNDTEGSVVAAQDEIKIEVSKETESAPAPSIGLQPVYDATKSSQPSTTATERHESTPLHSGRLLRPRTRHRKKRSPRLVIKVVLAVLLILTVIYGVLNREQVQKKYKSLVSSFIEKQVSIETNGRIGLTKLSGGYLTSNKEGNFFVIRGEAVNEFKTLRSSILVKGSIFTDNNTSIQSQSAYCGNPMNDNFLKKSSFKEIRDAMNNELGENLVNLNIPPDKSVPFTIVFNSVPKNIKEFTVEVLESKPGAK